MSFIHVAYCPEQINGKKFALSTHKWKGLIHLDANSFKYSERGGTISIATMKPTSELLIEKDAASSTPHVSVILHKQLIPLCPNTQYLLKIYLKTLETINCIHKG